MGLCLTKDKTKDKAKQGIAQKRGGKECTICLEIIDPQDIALLNCQHTYHRSCMFNHLKVELQKSSPNLKCPEYLRCQYHLHQQEVQMLLDEKHIQMYYKFALNYYVENNQFASYCPTPDCTLVFLNQGNVIQFDCSICMKSYCLKCKCDFHTGFSCQQYINQKQTKQALVFEKCVIKAKFKQCPKCKIWVERNQGCPSMTCRCGQIFCYTCGGVTCPDGLCIAK